MQALEQSGNGYHGSAVMIQPLTIRDEVIGEFSINNEGDQDGASEILSAVTELLGTHIENLRLSISNMSLLKSTEERAQREQMLRQITNALRSSTNPATILRTAVRELGSILGRTTVVQLASDKPVAQADTIAPNGNGGSAADRPIPMISVGGKE